MKYKNIILLLIMILSRSLTSCIDENDPVIKDFDANYFKWVRLYEGERKRFEVAKETTLSIQQSETLWSSYQDSTRNVILKKEIIYIRRMASASVMNSPTTYEKNYYGSVITENGRGAENEDFTVFALSDGTIIKASPKVNSEWLGTTVGEKVLKITGKRLKAKTESKMYLPATAQYFNWFGSWSWGGKEYVTVITGFTYEDYTTYQPLYQ